MKTTSFQADQDKFDKMDEIKKHLQEGFDKVTLSSGLPSRKVSQSDVVNYCIKYTFDALVEEGFLNEGKKK